MTEPLDLAAIKARADAATTGPWTMDELPETGECGVFGGPDVWYPEGRSTICGYVHYNNAEFIAHAREDIPALVDLAQRQATRITELEAEAKTPSARAELIRIADACEGSASWTENNFLPGPNSDYSIRHNREMAEYLRECADDFPSLDTSAVVQAIRDRALEEAAQIADEIKGSHYPQTMGWASAERVAAAIRLQITGSAPDPWDEELISFWHPDGSAKTNDEIRTEAAAIRVRQDE